MPEAWHVEARRARGEPTSLSRGGSGGRLAIDARSELLPRFGERRELGLNAGDHFGERLVGRSVLHGALQVVVRRANVIRVRRLDVLCAVDDVIPRVVHLVERGRDVVFRRAQAKSLEPDDGRRELVEARAQRLLRLRRGLLVAAAGRERERGDECERDECDGALHAGTTYVRATKSWSPRRRASNRIGTSPANIGMIATISAAKRTSARQTRGGSPKWSMTRRCASRIPGVWPPNVQKNAKYAPTSRNQPTLASDA